MIFWIVNADQKRHALLDVTTHHVLDEDGVEVDALHDQRLVLVHVRANYVFYEGVNLLALQGVPRYVSFEFGETLICRIVPEYIAALICGCKQKRFLLFAGVIAKYMAYGVGANDGQLVGWEPPLHLQLRYYPRRQR